MSLLAVFFFFFFFQAEDGIRDVAVTGVQTCALPIYPKEYTVDISSFSIDEETRKQVESMDYDEQREWLRSEERRVGKECRSRWSP